MHDVLDPRDLVPDEAQQLAHSGYEIGTLGEDAARAAEANDIAELNRIGEQLAVARRADNWPYSEPDDESTLLALAAAAPALTVDYAGLRDRYLGACQGRTVGNTLGKPVEGLSRSEIEIYLKADGNWPQTRYVGLVHPHPAGVGALHPDAPVSA